MKKPSLIIVLLIAFSLKSSAQFDSLNCVKRLNIETAKMVGYLNFGKFEKLAEATHPIQVQELGGKEKLIDTTRQMFATIQRDSQLLDVSKTWISLPEKVVVCNRVVQALVFKTIEIENLKDRKRSRKTEPLLAVSKDEGKTWHFVDISGKDQNAIYKYVPEFCLNVPGQ